jgi:cell fate (sporulation/competence/biofilm development) regulator YlbF (YheA/YmcA/DUF963 family)
MQTVSSPQLQEATQSLIDNLSASETFIHFQQAYARFNKDSEAHTLLEQLNQSQARMRQKQAKGGQGSVPQ